MQTNNKYVSLEFDEGLIKIAKMVGSVYIQNDVIRICHPLDFCTDFSLRKSMVSNVFNTFNVLKTRTLEIRAPHSKNEAGIRNLCYFPTVPNAQTIA